jgi:hypothetical protein
MLSDLPHYVSRQGLVTLGVDLGDVRFAVAQDDLGGFEAV